MTHVQVVLWSGFAIGVIFGAVGQRIDFCLTGGLREWWLHGESRRAGAFFFAMAVALAGTQLLAGLDMVDTGDSIYLQPGFSWLLMPLGGVLFGYGMILARGCGSRALVLLGDGNLRSLLVLLCLGIAAYVALTGLLAPLRLSIAEGTMAVPEFGRPGLPELLQSWGMGAGVARALPAAVIALALGMFALVRLGLYKAPWDIAGAAAVGVLVPAGWLVTGYFGADDFDPVTVESLTFVAPVGDTVQYLMLSTGTSLGFGVTVVGGVLLGAVAVSVLSRSFELRGFETPGQMLGAVCGGILMGVGGALALGCSVGQGLSGLSTLALPSFLSVAGILLGAFLALRGPLRAPGTSGARSGQTVRPY